MSEIITSESASKAKSKEQLTFEKQLNKIEQLKREVVFLEERATLIDKTIKEKIWPTLLELAQRRHMLIIALYNYQASTKLPKSTIQKIQDIVEYLCQKIELYSEEIDTNGWRQKFNIEVETEGNEVDETYTVSEDELLKESFFETIYNEFGIDLEQSSIAIDWDKIKNEDINYKTELIQKIIQLELENQKERIREEFGTKAAADFEKFTEREQKKIDSAQQKQKQADSLLQKDIKQIYLSLAKLLHPDSKNELDKTINKTALMQQVTHAYDSKDIYTLLHLYVHFKPNNANNISFKTINLALKQQIDTISQEHYFLKSKATHSGKFSVTATVESISKQLKKDITNLRLQGEYIKELAGAINQNDKGAINWIKNIDIWTELDSL